MFLEFWCLKRSTCVCLKFKACLSHRQSGTIPRNMFGVVAKLLRQTDLATEFGLFAARRISMISRNSCRKTTKLSCIHHQKPFNGFLNLMAFRPSPFLLCWLLFVRRDLLEEEDTWLTASSHWAGRGTNSYISVFQLLLPCSSAKGHASSKMHSTGASCKVQGALKVSGGDTWFQVNTSCCVWESGWGFENWTWGSYSWYPSTTKGSCQGLRSASNIFCRSVSLQVNFHIPL